MVIVDGEVDEGLFTLCAARRVGPRGAVLTVEPSTREFERPTANVAFDRLANVKTLRVALGSRPPVLGQVRSGWTGLRSRIAFDDV